MLTFDANLQLALDLFGVLVLAAAAALGGGVLRDLLIGRIPPVGISDWRLLTAAGVAGLATFVDPPGVERISRLVRVPDAAGLAVFAVSGSLIALGAGLAGQVPEVLRREMYALPALIGSSLIVTAHHFDVVTPAPIWGSVAVVFTLRMVAVVLDVHAPKPLRTGDLT
jgi:uncharacterized membrane protein YeiH